MGQNSKIVLAAALAALLGVALSIWLNPPAPLMRTEIGQRALQDVLAATAPTPPAGLAIARRGQPIPTLELPGLDGRLMQLPQAHAGRPQLINLWASWCGPCIEEMPELDRFAGQQGDQGTQVVGIALDDADAVRAFLERVPVRYPILIDAAGPADAGVQLGNVKGVLPYSVLVDAQGRLLKQKVGPFRDGEIDSWAAQ
ncbi:TlpA family protein disulfide reductase [Novilysobacter antarcticus]|uniref:TlpA family protein disulfide reductase n=1 Tax=Novilysobacter antarcticus TaxID=2862543 RepID=UPI001C9919DD|nr:TlpA disulfide reductase family protein [Lysobacter antarcticus]